MPLSHEDSRAIKDVFQLATDRFVSGDIAGWAALYTEDGVLMPPNAPSVAGRANVLAFGESLPKVTRFNFSGVGVDGDGNVAVGWCAFEMTVIGEDGSEVTDTGKQLVHFRRETNGNWRAARAIFNSDLPLG